MGVFAANTMVIRGAEPVIVDTGCSLVREHWLATVTSVVDPADVRWVFISHDDHDHIGNLEAILDLCPQATLVGNWAMTARLMGDVELPLHRMRWLDQGEALRRRRPHAAPGAPAAVRLAGHPRPVRPHHRRAVGGRHLRGAWCRATSSRPTTPTPTSTPAPSTP